VPVHSGLGERASYRNTLIIRAHIASTIRACENSIDGADKVVAQGLEGGVVAGCMADTYRRLPRGALQLLLHPLPPLPPFGSRISSIILILPSRRRSQSTPCLRQVRDIFNIFHSKILALT